MVNDIKILIIEDSKASVYYEVAQLKRSGFNVMYEQIENAEALRKALRNSKWDIILSDHEMPDFSSIKALKILNETNLDIPFIIVSDGIEEEIKEEAMRGGCKGYIMKDKLEQLGPVINREINELKIRISKEI